jgi:hypothetical protein
LTFAEQVECCRRWISSYATPGTQLRQSYGLKHSVENATWPGTWIGYHYYAPATGPQHGLYIYCEAFAKAALEAGYKPVRNHPRDPWFRIYERKTPRVPFIIEPHWQGAMSDDAQAHARAYVRERELTLDTEARRRTRERLQAIEAMERRKHAQYTRKNH